MVKKKNVAYETLTNERSEDKDHLTNEKIEGNSFHIIYSNAFKKRIPFSITHLYHY
jgi:hypothetical protein